MKIQFLFLAFLSLYFISCGDDDGNDNIPVDIDTFSVTVNAGVVEDEGMVTFNFQLPEVEQTDVYTYELTGTATVSEDYELPSDELSFTVLEGESTASISIAIIDDEDVESDDETIVLTLRERNGTVISSAPSATVMITDNDDFPFENGFLVVNRGLSEAGSFGTVSFINEDFSDVQDDIYISVNPGSDLGNSVQSIGFNGDFAYIVSSGSSRITVVNRFTFEEVARITVGLENPRHFVVVGDKGYVSNWGDNSNLDDDFIAVIDLSLNLVTDNIPVEEFPDRLEVSGTDLIIAHQGISTPQRSLDNFISIMDTTTSSIDDVISLDTRPNSIDLDGAGNLWVLTEPRPAVPIAGIPALPANISIIDLQSAEITNTTPTFSTTQNPSSLNIEMGFVYYYLSNVVSRLNIENTSVEGDFIITESFTDINVIEDLVIGINEPIGTVEAYISDTTTSNASIFGSQQQLGVSPIRVYKN